jgi:AbrB family looped-hinge helix DNA binding protein
MIRRRKQLLTLLSDNEKIRLSEFLTDGGYKPIMRDIFRLKIVSKRQVTLPQLLLEALRLREGDELEIEVENGEVISVRPLKLVPATFFTRDMLRLLESRSESMDAGIIASKSHLKKLRKQCRA